MPAGRGRRRNRAAHRDGPGRSGKRWQEFQERPSVCRLAGTGAEAAFHRGKARLFGISKRGDPYLRTLLIHGARSVVYRASRKTDPRSHWIADKQRMLGTSKAWVAMANKNARIVWSLIARGESYRRAA